jgi:hypothetical protein
MSCGGGHLGFPIGIKKGKMFQNASSLNPHGKLKPNCPGMIIGRSSVFYADRKSKMAGTTGHSINTEPYGENTESHFEFHIRTKNMKIVEDHPMNIHVQFGFNHICSF